MFLMPKLQSMLDKVIDWFMPDRLRGDVLSERRIRMFLISHIFGPVISHPITVMLMVYDPNPWPHVPILGASITLFWVFLFSVKYLPVKYETLALLSVQNLIFAILWGSYHYGGGSSPFLMWLLIVPLLAFFYLGSTPFTRLAILAEIGLSMLAFYASYLSGGFPVHIQIESLAIVGVLSAVLASAADAYTFGSSVMINLQALRSAQGVATEIRFNDDIRRPLGSISPNGKFTRFRSR